MRFLCLSDIHGNLAALSAVLAAAERLGYDKILVAGDLCYPGPEPLETWRRLMQIGAICVQGLSDKALATLDLDRIPIRSEHEKERVERLKAVRAELGELILARLEKLPLTHRIDLENGQELLLVHGSPVDPTTLIEHDLTDHEVIALMGDDPADVVVCGGTHSPFLKVIGELHVINVGSVGEAPSKTHAHVTLLEVTAANGVLVQQLGIPISS